MQMQAMILALAGAIGLCADTCLASEDLDKAWLTSNNEKSLVSDIEAVMAETDVPGAQVAIVLPNGGTWHRSFGVRDIASRGSMRDDTLVQAGSVTKVFTASLLADLVANGDLRWSDTIAEHLPGILMRADVAAITIDALATHTSGLPGNPPNRVDIDGIMQPYSVDQLYAALSDPSFTLEAHGRNYSNWGFAILGHIVEKVTGESFEEVLKARIFDPLEMKDSSIALSDKDEQRLAVHYWPEDAPHVPRPRWVFGEVAAFGGITSTASDLAKFLSYQIRPDGRPDILDPAEALSLRDIRVLLPNWNAGGGRSWLVVRDRGDGSITIEHSGEVDGHSSYIGFSPATGIGVAVTANLGGPSARRIALPVLARVNGLARARQATDRDDALLLARKRQWIDAEAALQKVTETSPDDGEAWHELGVARYEMRNLQGAMSALEQAKRTAEEPAASISLLGRIAASQNRVDDAFVLLDRAMQLDPAALDLDIPELWVLHADERWTKLVAMQKRSRRRSSPKK